MYLKHKQKNVGIENLVLQVTKPSSAHYNKLQLSIMIAGSG